MADPWTGAWEEAEASAPPGVLTYCTLELQHPAFLDENDDPVPVRCVTDVHEDMAFGIEDGAEFNAGEMATFQAVPFYAERPEFAEGRAPECTVTVDGVGDELIPRIEAAVEVKADLVVVYREYQTPDLSEPVFGPVKFVMRRVSVNGTTITGTAQLDDLANRKFPRRIATVRDFPGLVA